MKRNKRESEEEKKRRRDGMGWWMKRADGMESKRGKGGMKTATL
jgi:hypothetical protein